MSGDWGYGTVFKIFIWGYLIGGLTLLPAVLVVAWFYVTTSVDPESLSTNATDYAGTSEQQRTKPNASTARKGDENTHLGVGIDEDVLEKLKGRTHEPDVCAGYFAVCREYVPGGVNGKPPDRTTPAGAVISVESPSVYQSMYRSIFDRNKTMSPSLEASPNARSKKARNVFYVVLRLGHLMLYDNEDQLEVRHVISLAHYKVDIYGGGEHIPEGELWIKRNCIRLVQQLNNDTVAEAKSFYLFSDNCSEKEDFYHAMLHTQESQRDVSSTDSPSVPLKFDTPDLVKLVQQLHASEENLHTRWINALIGRVFLALYKTSQIKDFIATKINKKIARVPKPAIISSVELRKVDMGTSPPFITNPKLRELNVDGDLVVEADVTYRGNFRIEISATVRIDLGARFKAREVTIVLATVLKKLDGHILIRVKPPPSNRLWMTFETPPRMEFSLEPIVSSRQITYGVVLRAIESRIREVVNETLVLPNWDDMPFTDTIAQAIRGGIWQDSNKEEEHEDADKIKQDDPVLETAIIDAEKLDEKVDSALSISSGVESEEAGNGVSSSADYGSSSLRPRPMRSSSSAAQVKLESIMASAEMAHDRTPTPSSVRSLPIASPMRSPLRSGNQNDPAEASGSSSEDVSTASIYAGSTKSAPVPRVEHSHTRAKSRDLTSEEIAAAAAAAAEANSMNHPTRKQTINQSLNSATTAARNWLAAKQNPQSSRTNSHTGSKENLANNRPPTSEGISMERAPSSDAPQLPTRPQVSSQPSIAKSHTEPMGRGQPLPPPGTPLPLPKAEKRQTWAIPAAATTFAKLAKRKPIPITSVVSTKKSLEDLDASKPSSATSLGTASLHPPAYMHDDSEPRAAMEDGEEMFRRKSSASTTQDSPEMRRRKSSATSSAHSPPPPPLPRRKQRQPSVNLNAQQRRAGQREEEHGEGLLVVEAPVAEGSAPSSPARGDAENGKVSPRSNRKGEPGIT